MTTTYKGMDRRSFLKGAALFGGAAAAMGMASCAPSAAGEGGSSSSDGAGDNVTWDEEYDFVVVGGGNGAYAAILAAQAGYKTVLVEKGASYGGTTAFSHNGMWVPNNWFMADEVANWPQIVPDTDADIPEIVDYALSCDTSGAADRELVTDYVTNFAPALKKFGEMLNIEFAMGLIDDYYGLPGAKFGRQVNFAKDGEATGPGTFSSIIEPLVKEHNVEVRTNTPATRLYRDSEGRVVGVQVEGASGTVNIKANKGVLLNTGGFDHNEKMVHDYLRGPIMASNAVETNTGDGHRMAVDVGADLGNMSSVWGVPFYITADDAPLTGNIVDWMVWRYGDHSIIVNKHGKRFGDETASYTAANLAYYQYSTQYFGLENVPAFHIGDQSFVNMYGYPTVTDAAAELPEYIKQYDSLEELAADQGIDADALVAQVERWNEMCDKGADEDFGRPSSQWPKGPFFVHEDETCMGKIEQAPFFCVKIGPGTCGTNGGMRVNADAQVLDRDGEVIEGLYAAGNCSCAFFGNAYPGPGSTVGSAVYRNIRAANHALDLGII
ncbi:3-oxosteroid 1-dehydrogenase [Slackia heliotrinireducens]|uniref:Succinate dehydrogenase/fumarate reductase flavoprotein subunit n=1 Tax=Slackia heliotrinireducens (strain ATCC 29202 / DSM 20476 / NCTC 11029 / RHS 1) TaxID=471855 RepID=C7N3H5_SLAHD|nr:FAD-binding protein [Slackia heliotrinireducens]ACV23698.1 succinate dehydrogenase/fumarate reductase flavoprotein subunit [Slackia heliotrinireducens DSM 20476]VEH03263.1 3-oxosteroid 1-dehydrogenase [Slackia heliotrinireducens]